jgi:hypothetical protein
VHSLGDFDPGDDSDDSEDEEGTEAYETPMSERQIKQAVLTDKDKELGIVDAHILDSIDIQLHATSFEEFLVRTYFTEWASFASQLYGMREDNICLSLPIALEEYLTNVFSKKGRAMI